MACILKIIINKIFVRKLNLSQTLLHFNTFIILGDPIISDINNNQTYHISFNLRKKIDPNQVDAFDLLEKWLIPIFVTSSILSDFIFCIKNKVHR